jgi:starch phosphorylase
LHTRLLKEKIFPQFHHFFPGRFNSKTNGITPRRWLLKANPRLADLISSKIGSGWITDLDQLRGLESFADERDFQTEWQAIKRANKERLAALILEKCGVEVSLDSMFDIQVKRIHEYKRQLLNCLHIIALYHKILRRPDLDLAPRTVIFAGKAAPSYWKAKLIIKLINSIAEVVNHDPRVGSRLRVVFLPNYNVSQAEVIMPAADLSEQISTAGTEASGTGNMKFSLNGALTIGTLDGANIEIQEEVGAENIFIFGMTAEEAEYEKLNVSRTPMAICRDNEEVAQIIDSIRDGSFSRGDKDLFRPLVDSLLDQHDPYLLLLDLESYLVCQDRVNTVFLDPVAWSRMSVLNVAGMGKFSSDRTITQYAREIWGVPVNGEP